MDQLLAVVLAHILVRAIDAALARGGVAMTSLPTLGAKTRPSEPSPKQTAGNPYGRVTLREILATLGEHERARKLVMGHFRERGGELDHVDGVRAHRDRMADAVTYAEDRIEFDQAGRARQSDAVDRVALRDVRRRLEVELWP